MASGTDILQRILEQIYGAGAGAKNEMYKNLDDFRREMYRDLGIEYGADTIPPTVVGGRPPQPSDEMYVNTRVVPPPMGDYPDMFDGGSFDVTAPSPTPDGEVTMYTDAVRQPGGGNYSEVRRSNVPYDQTDEALFKYVSEQIPFYEAQRKLDPRSREYDPKGAELLLNAMSQAKQDAAYTLRSKAEQQKAEAQMKEAQLMEALTQQGMIPSGMKQPKQPAGQPTQKEWMNNILSYVEDLDKTLPMTASDEDVQMVNADKMRIKALLAMNRPQDALRILGKYEPEFLKGNPEYAPVPPGVDQLGERAVSPQGRTLYRDPETGELIYG